MHTHLHCWLCDFLYFTNSWKKFSCQTEHCAAARPVAEGDVRGSAGAACLEVGRCRARAAQPAWEDGSLL